jgi:hypothetical protein
MSTMKILPLLVPLAALTSCSRPAALDIAVVSVALTPAPAGRPTTALVTVANRGMRTLRPQDYLIEIEAPGTPEELRHNACGAQHTHVFMDAPEEIPPGQTRVIPVHHLFARAGRQELTVHATLAAPEDGSHRDNALTIRRTVPASPCANLASR